MTSFAKKLIDQVMDKTPRNVEQILDLMLKELERSRDKGVVSGRYIIPTRNELAYYLPKNYNKVRISLRTGQEVRSSGPNTEVRYFR